LSAIYSYNTVGRYNSNSVLYFIVQISDRFYYQKTTKCMTGLNTYLHTPQLNPIHNANATQLDRCVASALAVCIEHWGYNRI